MKSRKMWIAIVACVVAVVAIVCTVLLINHDTAEQAGDVLVDNNTASDEKTTNFTRTYKLVGFNIPYPENSTLKTINGVRIFTSEQLYSVIIGAPSALGIFLDADSLEDSVPKCSPYIIETLEFIHQDLLSAGFTTQRISTQKEVVNNGIPMLKVTGIFENTSSGGGIDYVAYYFLIDSDPVYIVGIQLDNDSAGLEEFMDEMASHIKK